ncbi:hypothetical protein HDU93_004400, partial [Gonapodya sp. JEL0774]
GIALCQSEMEGRRQKALMYIAPVIVSVIADAAVLIFYAVAAGYVQLMRLWFAFGMTGFTPIMLNPKMNISPLSGAWAIAVISVPSCFAIAGGLAYSLAPDVTEGEVSCMSIIHSGPLSYVMMAFLGFAFVASLALSAAVAWSVQNRAEMDTELPDTMRVASMGIVAVSTSSKDNTSMLSRRLVMYPLIILVTGLAGVAMASLPFDVVRLVG